MHTQAQGPAGCPGCDGLSVFNRVLHADQERSTLLGNPVVLIQGVGVEDGGCRASSPVGTQTRASGGSHPPNWKVLLSFRTCCCRMAGWPTESDGWAEQIGGSRQFYFPSAPLVQHQRPFHSPTPHLLVCIQTCWISPPISMFQSV